MSSLPTSSYTCAKCGNQGFETGQSRTTGGLLSKIFDVQNRKFTTVSCRRCHYTEFYNTDSSTLGSVFDFLTQ